MSNESDLKVHQSTIEENDKDLKLAEMEAEVELPLEIIEKRKKGLLRTGFTTGTSATAATKAALLALITSQIYDILEITLPKGKSVQLKIAWTKYSPNTQSVTSAVIKDAGDDPDVTHGAEICSTVSLTMNRGCVEIDGGIGVGRVTRPGLGLEIGHAAINPVPRKMIEQVVRDAAKCILIRKGVKVIISVPKGIELAKKTDNPRLGIVGGISILGTTGIVFPYSTASFAASIRQSLDVAQSLGTDVVVLTTGGRSEDYIKNVHQSLPDYVFVQMGDFSGYTIKQCENRNIKKVIIAGFIGKLTKMAMGIKQTHVRGSHVSMEYMANLASLCINSKNIINDIRNANTARHVSEIIIQNNVKNFFELLCKQVYLQMYSHSNKSLEIEVVMFGFDGKILGKYP
ncbi:MAG TPA: cobalt-precorrin-5B (C(1))-methyltransferase [Nitrososphaeraceae archaeon]|nr:cobalt-precorrin-5B (C(1))-methyltransferase [Nitrososphaeraceae archaeon]